jgi:hypothetical protein
LHDRVSRIPPRAFSFAPSSSAVSQLALVLNPDIRETSPASKAPIRKRLQAAKDLVVNFDTGRYSEGIFLAR